MVVKTEKQLRKAGFNIAKRSRIYYIVMMQNHGGIMTPHRVFTDAYSAQTLAQRLNLQATNGYFADRDMDKLSRFYVVKALPGS